MKAVRALLVALVLAACSTPSPSAVPSNTPVPVPTPSEEPSTEPTPAASETPGEAQIADDPPSLALEEVASGLDAPINITFTPDGALLVNERNGRVMAIDPDSGDASVFLDLTDRVLGDGEQGMLGLALHPGWPEPMVAFVHYTDLDGNTVIAKIGAPDEPTPPRLDASTERVILRQDQPYPNHNGGQLAFGPDGRLYIGLGDGGSGGDPLGNGQDPTTLLGKILRVDVDVGGESYTIPDGNPYADGQEGASEVFLIGLRNPWRFSFDRATGQLWIGDVGQNAEEEIDRVDPTADAGANLGWNVMEASQCFVEANCATDGLTLPIVEYGRDLGCSVTGGYVYRGAAIPDLGGWYLFSDYCTGLLFGVPSDAEGVIGPRTLLETGIGVSTFGEGPDGELYVAAIGGGAIYRIVAGD